MSENQNAISRLAFERHRKVTDDTWQALSQEIARGGIIILQAVQTGHTLFFCGNGGSAADSQHFAAEFVCKYKDNRQPLPAIALTANSSVTTAIGNDYGFAEVFRRQITALGKEGDVLIAITTSGASENVLNAIKEARRKKIKVIALTGEKGVVLREMADVCLAIPSFETARVQEMHELILHSWCELVDTLQHAPSV